MVATCFTLSGFSEGNLKRKTITNVTVTQESATNGPRGGLVRQEKSSGPPPLSKYYTNKIC